ncbi:unnamed protein product [Sphagnum balticum]
MKYELVAMPEPDAKLGNTGQPKLILQTLHDVYGFGQQVDVKDLAVSVAENPLFVTRQEPLSVVRFYRIKLEKAGYVKVTLDPKKTKAEKEAEKEAQAGSEEAPDEEVKAEKPKETKAKKASKAHVEDVADEPVPEDAIEF